MKSVGRISTARPKALAIRPLVPADDEQILSLNASAQPNVALLDRAELCRLRALSDGHVVAAQEGVILGYALTFCRDDAYDGEEFLMLRAMIPQPFSYIDQVVVRGSAQGTGIGRFLYEFIEHTALIRAALWLCCEVNTVPPNPNSLAFHTRMGFSTLGSLATQDGRHVSLLQKRLSAAA